MTAALTLCGAFVALLVLAHRREADLLDQIDAARVELQRANRRADAAEDAADAARELYGRALARATLAELRAQPRRATRLRVLDGGAP